MIICLHSTRKIYKNINFSIEYNYLRNSYMNKFLNLYLQICYGMVHILTKIKIAINYNSSQKFYTLQLNSW